MADKIIAPRRNEVLTSSGTGTTRFMDYLEQSATHINEIAATVDAQTVQILAASIFELQARLGSGDFLTSDTTSFTVDSTVLFADMTEA